MFGHIYHLSVAREFYAERLSAAAAVTHRIYEEAAFCQWNSGLTYLHTGIIRATGVQTA